MEWFFCLVCAWTNYSAYSSNLPWLKWNYIFFLILYIFHDTVSFLLNSDPIFWGVVFWVVGLFHVDVMWYMKSIWCASFILLGLKQATENCRFLLRSVIYLAVYFLKSPSSLFTTSTLLSRLICNIPILLSPRFSTTWFIYLMLMVHIKKFLHYTLPWGEPKFGILRL